MKNVKRFTVFLLFIGLTAGAFGQNYKTITVDAPFKMEPVKEFIFPKKDFLITRYGAKPGGVFNNTKAIAKAIAACNKAGGGRVCCSCRSMANRPGSL